MLHNRIIIVGASTRAAAFSALRAGLTPWCYDLFADSDLRACCEARAVSSKGYPQNFGRAMRSAPPGPWMYTGGLENYPHLIRMWASERLLWGNGENELKIVRDPVRIATCIADANLPVPMVRLRPKELTADRRWLVKPFASAGGRGIHFRQPDSRIGNCNYFQEYIDGEPVAAIFVACDEQTQLLGVTRQLVGEGWLHANRFSYCGSVGPLPPSAPSRSCFEQIGEALARACGLRGLFGVDAILRDGMPYVVEVNPRYTASVEVLENATAVSALALHRRAFDASAPMLPLATSSQGMIGKAIYFARRTFAFPDQGPWLVSCSGGFQPPRPLFADIPAAGTKIPAGSPVLTFFAKGSDVESCIAELQRIARDLDRWLIRT